jgi:cobalamin biosynthesis protein CobT
VWPRPEDDDDDDDDDDEDDDDMGMEPETDPIETPKCKGEDGCFLGEFSLVLEVEDACDEADVDDALDGTRDE